MKRANYIGAPAFYNLNQACRVLTEAFGYSIYLVGSSLEKRDYRDVDVRCIMADEEFERLFPGLAGGNPGLHALWSLMCSSISLWLSQASGLPVDFQIQQQTTANAEFTRQPRHPLGVFLDFNEAADRRRRDAEALDFKERAERGRRNAEALEESMGGPRAGSSLVLGTPGNPPKGPSGA